MQFTWRSGVVTVGMVAALTGAGRAAIADPSPDKVAASQLVARVNQERAASGLPPVGLSDVAVEIAESWSVHMSTTQTLAHNDAWFSAETKARAGANAAGENVAYNRDLADAHNRLMQSSGHRANILDPRFHAIGIGAVRDGDGMWWITEDFLQFAVVGEVEKAIAPPPPAPAQPEEPVSAPPAPPAPVPAVSPPVSTERTDGVPSPVAVVPPSTVDAGASPAPVSSASHGRHGPWTTVQDVVEVASGRRFVGPSATPAGLPPALVATAALGVLYNMIAIVHRRRISPAVHGKGGKITHS